MKPISLEKDDYLDKLAGHALDVKALEGDARMAGVDVKGADLNGDGKIEGDDEQKRLFAKLDEFDDDGRSSSIRLIGGDGATKGSYDRMQAIADAAGLTDDARTAITGGKPEANDDVMHIGLRDASKKEAARLKEGLGRRGRLVAVGSKSHDKFLAADGNRYDLTTRSGIDGYAKTLGLPAAQTKAIADAIENAPTEGRDEMAHIAGEWAKAEKGGRTASRISISGHHVAGRFWGERGRLTRDALIELAAAMPKAAAQVEDIHLSACYCQGRNGVRKFMAAFPNAKTILAYDDGTPSVENGADRLQAKWEKATRGRSQRVKSRVSGSVTWTKARGFEDGLTDLPLADLKAGVARRRSTYEKFFRGDEVVKSHATGPLREYYAALVELAAHPELDATEAKKLEAEGRTTIRLIYFDTIARAWSGAKKDLVADGYAAAGLKAPDFAKASRKDALAHIDDFLTKTDKSTDPKILALRTELLHLKNLDADEMDRWI